MSINVNVTYHGPSLTLSPTSNVVFKLGLSTPWASWAPNGLRSSSWLQSLQIYKNLYSSKIEKLYKKINGTHAVFKLYNPCKNIP